MAEALSGEAILVATEEVLRRYGPAKATVVDLLTAFGHEDVVDLGGIATARGPEMYLPLWLRLMGALGTADFNLRVVR